MMTQPIVETQDTQDSDLAALAADVDQALSAYESELAQLKATQEVYAPPELQRRRALAESTLTNRLDSVLTDGDARAQQRLDTARRDLAMLDGDPVERLPAPDLQRAAALAPFVRETVASLPVPTLAAELERRRLAGDRVTLALWVRYTVPVLEETHLAAAAQGKRLDRDGQALAAELDRAQAALVDDATRERIAQARAAEKRALAFKAGLTQLKTRDPRYQQRIRDKYGPRI